MVEYFLKFLVSAILLLGALIGVLWFIRRKGIMVMPRKGFMEVIDNISLGGRKVLCAVKVGRKILVIALTENSASLLTTLEEDWR